MKRAPTKLSHIYQCSGCDSFALAPLARAVERNGHEKIVPGVLPVGPQVCLLLSVTVCYSPVVPGVLPVGPQV